MSLLEWKTLLEKEKMLVTSIFFFSNNVFKRLLFKDLETRNCSERVVKCLNLAKGWTENVDRSYYTRISDADLKVNFICTNIDSDKRPITYAQEFINKQLVTGIAHGTAPFTGPRGCYYT